MTTETINLPRPANAQQLADSSWIAYSSDDVFRLHFADRSVSVWLPSFPTPDGVRRRYLSLEHLRQITMERREAEVDRLAWYAGEGVTADTPAQPGQNVRMGRAAIEACDEVLTHIDTHDHEASWRKSYNAGLSGLRIEAHRLMQLCQRDDLSPLPPYYRKERARANWTVCASEALGWADALERHISYAADHKAAMQVIADLRTVASDIIEALGAI